MQERRYARIFLFVLFLILLYFILQVFRPFLLPFTLALVLTSLCYPLFDRVCALIRGRRGWASLLTCLAITALIMVPLVLLLALLVGEVNHVYQQFQKSLQAGELQSIRAGDYRLVGPLLEWVESRLPAGLDLMRSFVAAVQQVSVLFLRQGTAILSGLFQLVLNFLIMVVTMFFLFRDGPRLMDEVKTWTPLSARQERLIVDKFRQVASATVLGSLLTALAQGAAGGLVFWVLDVPNPLLWGVLMALFSLVPVVGTALVWLPWSIYFFSIGATLRAVLLIVLAVAFVGMIDNILRPLVIEGRTRMHTLLVFFSIMGGIAYFGMAGLILGPILVALGLTLVELYKLEFQQELSKPEE